MLPTLHSIPTNRKNYVTYIPNFFEFKLDI